MTSKAKRRPSPPETRRRRLNSTRLPERTCIGCRTRRPQAALVRVAIGSGGRLVASRTAPGRGAWLCDPPAQCLQMARQRRGFDKAFRQSVTAPALDELDRVLREMATGKG